MIPPLPQFERSGNWWLYAHTAFSLEEFIDGPFAL